MKTGQLDDQTSSQTVDSLWKVAAGEGGDSCDAEGNVGAFVLPTDNDGARSHAVAYLDTICHQDQIMRAQARKGGVTTKQLLGNARKVADAAGRGGVVFIPAR